MLFGGYGLHYEVWLCYLVGMVVLFGGYGLHYEVWLCYLVGMVFIMRYGCVIWCVWSSL